MANDPAHPPEPRPYPAPQRHAFVDAYGDPSLATNNDGVTGSFIVTAVIVGDVDVQELRRRFEEVRARHFGGGEMKSINVGKDDHRRARILTDLLTLNFKFLALAVDKGRVRKDGGLIYKSPFLKFVHRYLFESLYRAHPSLSMTVDNHGRQKFMDEFVAYIRREVHGDLFEKPAFKFADSKVEPLLQIADFISGALARVYDAKKVSPRAQEFTELMRTHALSVTTWPPKPRPPPPVRGEGTSHDHAVRDYCVHQSARALAEYSNTSDPNRAAQAAFLECLLFHFDWVSETEWVSTAVLQEAIKERLGHSLQEQQLRSSVVAPLRDEEVVIASSRRGYKIPASVEDLMSFVARTDATVYPMIQRLERARRNVHVVTNGAVDILQDERYAYLRAALATPPAVRPTGEDGDSPPDA
ncbi:DUF3800 domain-containing protein [Corallococcus exercitus]|uniref:DUF3800 domain-containing protein n=1 Tax=Corallococcus exercitus TaxID=2316736 RepID=A0A7Y4NWH5_9BACT|nr:DUF3800 domain-containing protein [Corallococcus exercitus]NOK39669.1 DUF3800 domain-containing protein [Corallococcus exercitus]